MGSADRWSYVAGEKGRNRVRAYEKSNSSNLYLEFSERDPETGEWQKRRISAQTSDKAEAKRKADQLAAKWADGRTPDEDRPEEITVSELFDRYLERRSPQLSDSRQRYHRQMRDLFCQYFGPEREAVSVNRADWDRFIQDRRSGSVDARGRAVTDPEEREPRSLNTVKKNLKALRAVLNWGVAADLLDANPTEGYPLPSDNNPPRPRVPQERYEAMLEVAGEVDWRFRLALVLVHETGHRIGAVRRLRWSDVDLQGQIVRWRGDDDKSDHEHVIPLTETAVEALQAAQGERLAVGEAWVFSAPQDEAKPCSKSTMRGWWLKAEELAGLEHIDGLGWHGLRRKFADELREASTKEIADLGGWKSPRTVSEVYQGSDLGAMREAQRQRRTLREGAISADN